jgi:molecular chaperone DnaK (HSP70)
MIASLVERTIACVHRAIADAKLTADDIDDVVLVGGSTRIPLVRRRLEQDLGRAPHTGVDPDLAVALGAAIQADVLAGNDKSLRIFAFTDLGNVWGEGDSFSLASMRSSAGLGLSWVSPVGPLKLSWGKPLRAFATDRIQEFQFQIGTAF